MNRLFRRKGQNMNRQLQHAILNRPVPWMFLECTNTEIILRIASDYPPRIPNVEERADEFWTSVFIWN